VKTATAWPRVKRIHTAKKFCDPTTAMGNKIKEAALTTMVKRAARARMADRLAKKMARQGKRQRNEVGVVAAIEKEGVPAPESGGSGDGEGKHEEEIFVGHGGGIRIEDQIASQIANQ